MVNNPVNKKAGANVYIELEVRDTTKDPSVLVDADSIDVFLIRPDGTRTDAITPTHLYLGTYGFTYQTSSEDLTGMWQITSNANYNGCTDTMIPTNVFLLS